MATPTADANRLQTLARLADALPRPAALVDLDAFEANLDRLVAGLGPGATTLRIASKSVRHRGLLRRALDRGGPRVRGLMCYHAAEAARLFSQSFDDLLVAYPTTQRAALGALADAVAAGATARIVVDSAAHLDALERAGAAAGVVLDALIDLDVSLRLGGAHLGVRRSPIRTAAAAAALAEGFAARPHTRLVGLMGYEAHIAGLPDHGLRERAFKRVARPPVRRLRAEVVAALRAAGHEMSVINGGGTGSVPWSAADPALTEVTAGSGLLCSHLFDANDAVALRPALFLAFEACRLPDPEHVTLGGGGIIASGPAAADRLPQPVWPPGLSYVSMEGAGEVQTPLRRSAATPAIEIGDTVLMRPAKAGEPAERFAAYHLVRGETIVAVEPTYRGEGQVFL
ncbi:MAG: alanine racemase [Myxococcales bacterium]|nr:alanine racemase [Myxococcales bacterium]